MASDKVRTKIEASMIRIRKSKYQLARVLNYKLIFETYTLYDIQRQINTLMSNELAAFFPESLSNLSQASQTYISDDARPARLMPIRGFSGYKVIVICLLIFLRSRVIISHEK